MEYLDLTIAQLIPLLVFQIFTLITYGTYLTLKGIQLPLPSISESYYALKPHNQSNLFLLFMGCVGIPFLFYQSPWFFIAGSMFTAVGVAAKFKDYSSTTDEVHYVAAIAGIIASLIGLLSWGILWPAMLTTIISMSLFLWGGKNTIWWVEIGAIVSIIGGIMDKMGRMLG